MLVCVFLQFCTRDRRCSAHPAFPAPSVIIGRNFLAKLGRIAPRDRGVMVDAVIASEAKQSSFATKEEKLDCSVASLLAMTAAGACHRAGIHAIPWRIRPAMRFSALRGASGRIYT